MSILIYAVVRAHLVHRLEARCRAALETVIASVEFDPSGLEWESNIRRLEFEQSPGDGPMIWGIFESDGKRVDGSQSHEKAVLDNVALETTTDEPNQAIEFENDRWLVFRRVLHPTGGSETTVKADSPQDAGTIAPMAATPAAAEADPIKRYPALIIAAATPIGPTRAPLGGLAIALASISIAVWVSAAVFGRYLCAKALAPLSRMAAVAGEISAADFSRRLPSPRTGDELDDLSIALNDLLDRLQASFEQQRRFAAEASHQLRTPLTAIIGQLEVALRRKRSATEYRQALDSAQRQAEVLRQIVETLLFLTRENENVANMNVEQIELHDWLTAHLESWRARPRFADLQLEFDSDRPLWVTAHPVLLGQALDNLLDNACKYSDPNSPIRVHAGQPRDELSIEVRDQGYGIAASEIPQVFAPFFRGARSRQDGAAGVGLGLSVVKRIATFFRGRVTVESTVDRGSCFTIILPSAKQSAAQPEELTV